MNATPELEGWNYFDPDNLKKALVRAQQPNEEYLELAKAFRRVFSTPDGAVVLHHLHLRTLETPVLVPGIPDPVISAGIREGENNLYRYIAHMIGVADRQPIPTEEDTTDEGS